MGEESKVKEVVECEEVNGVYVEVGSSVVGIGGDKKVEKERIEGCHSSQCEVCLRGLREEVEGDYVKWVPVKEISDRWGIARETIERHCKYYKLKEKKNKNYLKVLDRMIELGDLGLEAKEMKPRDLRGCIELKAKLEGQLVDKKSVDVNVMGKVSKAELMEGLRKLGIKLRAEEPVGGVDEELEGKLTIGGRR